MDDKQSALLAAARQGQWQVVSQALGATPRLNCRDEAGLSPLLYAIGAGQGEIVAQLINAGADVNFARPPHGMTPLMLAASQQQTAIAERLIAAGAAIDQGNDDGSTALMIAAFRGDRPMVKLLLAAGADLNHQDRDGATALQLALQGNHRPVVTLLLEHGANTDRLNVPEDFPLDWVIAQDNLDLLQCLNIPLDGDSWLMAASEGKGQMIKGFLQDHWPVDYQDDQGDTALHLACLEGHLAIVQQLLAAQATVDVVNQAGDTPLILAIAQGEGEIVRQLLGAGADPNFSPTGEFPLLMALTTNTLAGPIRGVIVAALLEAGANAQQPVNQGQTPLMLAVAHNHVNVLPLLIAAGADVNQTDAQGASALMWACHRGHLEAVKALLQIPGIRINHKNPGGLTALDLAQLNRQAAIAALLRGHGS
ncbi:MAG: ankyrin repeat domain-containing protein [Synechocystis sp.]|nr:ankyrin repeat domain-containing protein [Synechocystis sp.]